MDPAPSLSVYRRIAEEMRRFGRVHSETTVCGYFAGFGTKNVSAVSEARRQKEVRPRDRGRGVLLIQPFEGSRVTHALVYGY